MKKLLFAVIMAVLLMITACSNGSSSAADTVKDMYAAALDNDSETFEQIISQNSSIANHYDQALEGLGSVAEDAGGVEKMTFNELKKEDIQKKEAEHLDNSYENGWTLVEVTAKGQDPYFWIVTKIDDTYKVLDREDTNEENLLKVVDGKNIEKEKAKEEAKKKAQAAKKEQETADEGVTHFKEATANLAGMIWASDPEREQVVEVTITEADETNLYVNPKDNFIVFQSKQM